MSKSPTPKQITRARADAGLTQREAASLMLVSLSGFQHWEYGVRAMHPAMWELFQIKLEKKL